MFQAYGGRTTDHQGQNENQKVATPKMQRANENQLGRWWHQQGPLQRQEQRFRSLAQGREPTPHLLGQGQV